MFVPTRSSKLKQDSGESCKTVIFESKKPEKVIPTITNTKTEKNEEEEGKNAKWDMKKLRYDIIKFGTAGLDATKKEESKVALVVALGAKPPKKKPKNYKLILAEKKVEKEQRAHANKQNLSKPYLKKGEFKRKSKNKNESRGLLDEYGKVRLNK